MTSHTSLYIRRCVRGRSHSHSCHRAARGSRESLRLLHLSRSGLWGRRSHFYPMPDAPDRKTLPLSSGNTRVNLASSSTSGESEANIIDKMLHTLQQLGTRLENIEKNQGERRGRLLQRHDNQDEEDPEHELDHLRFKTSDVLEEVNSVISQNPGKMKTGLSEEVKVLTALCKYEDAFDISDLYLFKRRVRVNYIAISKNWSVVKINQEELNFRDVGVVLSERASAASAWRRKTSRGRGREAGYVSLPEQDLIGKTGEYLA